MRTGMILTLRALLLLTISITAHADGPHDVLSRYRSALQQQDATTLAALFRPGATIRIVIAAPNEEELVLTLTRDQYLQQLRALWRFALSQSYDQSDIHWARHGTSTEVSLRQIERYQLFGETLTQDAQVRMEIGADNMITTINVQTLDW